MSQKKKAIREDFRKSVFERDKYKCRMCGEPAIDPHHITDRNLMPNGGYVKENGISLCAECHLKAEEFHQTGTACSGYAPDDLYAKIGSSHETAVRSSQKLSI